MKKAIEPRLVLVVVLVSFISCSTPEESFQSAKQKNTVEAFQRFIEKYPDSPLAKQAHV